MFLAPSLPLSSLSSIAISTDTSAAPSTAEFRPYAFPGRRPSRPTSSRTTPFDRSLRCPCLQLTSIAFVRRSRACPATAAVGVRVLLAMSCNAVDPRVIAGMCRTREPGRICSRDTGPPTLCAALRSFSWISVKESFTHEQLPQGRRIMQWMHSSSRRVVTAATASLTLAWRLPSDAGLQLYRLVDITSSSGVASQSIAAQLRPGLRIVLYALRWMSHVPQHSRQLYVLRQGAAATSARLAKSTFSAVIALERA